MQYSINELKKYQINLPVDILTKKLVQLGHEVEEVISYQQSDLICVGHVLEKEKHPDADKLNITKVDVGDQVLQIVCGATNVAVGQKVIVAKVGTDLKSIDLQIKPIILKGVESNGMICSLSEVGYSNKVLNQIDSDGIHLLDSSAIIGDDALKYIGLDDQIVDVSLTADRGDCQNYLGISKDLKAVMQYDPRLRQYLTDNETIVQKKEFKLIDNQLIINNEVNETKYFSMQTFHNIEVDTNSNQFKYFLQKQGIKAQNNLVDLSNYMMFKYGIPTHMYDLDKVVGNITIKLTNKEELFTGLDNQEYKISIGSQVICDQEKVIAIAGVMGSFETRITKETKNIIAEVAIFDQTHTRLSAKNVKGKTEASIRFEKGVDGSQLANVHKELLNHIEADNISNINIAVEFKALKKSQIFYYKSVLEVLGIEIDKLEIKNILQLLGFIILKEDNNQIEFEVPEARHDINYENDLLEEIIRIYDMDNIEISDKLYTFNTIESKVASNRFKVERYIEKRLLNANIDQTLTYSLTTDNLLNQFSGILNTGVYVSHPISNERKVYRQSLLPSLLEVTKYNLDRQKKEIKIFEIGNIYYEKNKKIIEELKVAGVVAGQYQNQYQGNNREYDFFDLKGIVEDNLFNNLDVEYLELEDSIGQLNKYASATIKYKGNNIGFVGQLNPNYLKKVKYPVFVFEITLDSLIDSFIPNIEYQKVSNLPSIHRDLTIVVKQDVLYNQVRKIFNGIDYLIDYKLIDVYLKDDEQKSITFKVEFMNQDKTLTSKEVEEEVEKIVKNINDLGFEFFYQ